MRFLVLSLGALTLAAPGAAAAQVTQSYTYDANGRLTGVATAGGAGTHASAYAYDDADNRTSRSRTGTSAWAALLELPAGQALRPDQALTSPDGRYSLALRPSGRMELWSAGAPAPMLAGTASVADAFRLADDGQARFLPASAAGAWVSLRDDGALVLTSETGDEVWRSGEAFGQEVVR